MPARFPSIPTALRPGARCTSQSQCAQLSTTSRAAALKNFLDPSSFPPSNHGRRSGRPPPNATATTTFPPYGSRGPNAATNNNNSNNPSPNSPRPTQSSTDAILALYKEGSGAFRDEPAASASASSSDGPGHASSTGPSSLSLSPPPIGRYGGRRGGAASAMQEVSESAVSGDYMRQQPRRWRAGDVYAPRDLGPREMMKWRRQQTVKEDVLDMLGLNPLDNYRNFSMISEFMTPFGRIKHSQETGLRPVNQRKMAKAIRRAIGLGIHPSVHRHPELLRRESQNMAVQTRSSDPKRKKTFG